MFMMTKQQALDIQHKQLLHYFAVYGDPMLPVIKRIMSMNRPEELDDEPHPSWEVHRRIPCGGSIESVMIDMGVKRAERYHD
jgi:hypothetical protein